VWRKNSHIDPAPEQVCACHVTHTVAENRWRRTVTELVPGLFLTGEPEPGEFSDRYREWSSLGLELVIDLTFGASADFDRHGLRVLNHPETDDGSRKPLEWFDDVVSAARQSSTLMYCHTGTSCGPSVAFAALLDRGYDEFDALDCLFAARPVVTVTYSAEAMEWRFGRQNDPERADRLEGYKHYLLSRAGRTPLGRQIEGITRTWFSCLTSHEVFEVDSALDGRSS
jgi:hypothetical protein